jgi:hypothetical protein
MSIIGIHGYIESGKDTVANIIKKIDAERDWKIKKFASKLKQIATILTGIPSEMFENQDFKKTYLGNEWDLIKKTDHTLIENGKAASEYIESKMSVRDMLQKLGTEAMRNGLHPDVWVNALFADYKDVKQSEDGLIHEKYGEHDITIVPNPILWKKYYPNWIISDLRFPNEYDAIKKKGGLCIKVVRPVVNKSTSEQHISEYALEYHTFDYTLDNSGDIDDLEKEVRQMLFHIKLND